MSLKKHILNFFNSHIDIHDIDHHKYYISVLFLLFIIFIAFILSLVNIFVNKMYLLGVLDFIVAFITFLILIYAKIKQNIFFITHVIVIFLLFATNSILYLNENQTFTFIWAALLPIFPFLFVGKKWGLYYLIIHFILVSIISVEGLSHWVDAPYSFSSTIRLLLAITTLGLFMYLYESNRAKAYKRLDEYKNDLEEKVQLEIKKHQSTQAILSQQSKMAAMGEMLASIGHQWKQPLSVISTSNTSLELASTLDTLTKEEIHTHIHTLNEQITFMSQTLREFSNFFRPNKQKESFCIESAFSEILKLFNQLYIVQNVHINVNLSQCHTIYGHKNEFLQVILNIINNARDVLVETECENRNIDITFSNSHNNIECEVQDYAGGVPDDVLTTIFDQFITTKEENKGSGLGLYMSKMIIESSMQGTLEAKNQKGGACFVISLPSEKTT